jgi:hypothetical protein
MVDTTNLGVTEAPAPEPLPKLKTFEVVLSSGQVKHVHESHMGDLATFMQAMPALSAMKRAMQAIKDSDSGIAGLVQAMPSPAEYEGIFPLLAIMSDLTVEEFKQLPLWDGMAILGALGEFIPNEKAAESTPQASPSSTPSPQG